MELKKYFVVPPALRGFYRDRDFDYPDTVSTEIQKAYVSANEPPLPYDQLATFLSESGFLQPDPSPASEAFQQRHWPGEDSWG